MITSQDLSRVALAAATVLSLGRAARAQEAAPAPQTTATGAASGESAAGGAALPTTAEARAPDAPDPMEDLFVRKCASCHTVGKGQRVGPDLQGAHQRRERSWLVSMIRMPSSMLATDPVARRLVQEFQGVRMPDLGLSLDQVEGLADLIARCSAEPCELVGELVPVATATAEDVERGRALYLGTLPLSGAGAQCVSCHTVRGSGSPVPGGLLARDLTHAFGRLGDEGLDAALKNPAFPVMNRVYADHPLTADEVFALRAFLHEANRREPAPETTYHPLLVAVIGTLVVLAILNAAWARRLRGVRAALYRGTPGEGLQ